MAKFVRPSGREVDALRPVCLETGVSRYAEGSCLAKFGHTHVLCTASWSDRLPGWRRGSGKGWITAEYGMLPRATHERTRREATQSGQSGRTREIQRLIGRSLRAVVDLSLLGEHQITLDCDVIQADGGTRTAAITGGFVALSRAFTYLVREGVIKANPIQKQAAAVSIGLWNGTPVLDVDYHEDSQAIADMNVVMSSDGGFVEVQGTGETRPISRNELTAMLHLAEQGCTQLFALQNRALAAEP